jgi:hypothetical protein
VSVLVTPIAKRPTTLAVVCITPMVNLQRISRKALRKNYAGIGYTFDEERDAFIPT